jgi:hypothetical protein
MMFTKFVYLKPLKYGKCWHGLKLQMRFYELPKFIYTSTHFIQFKDTLIEVSNAHLNTQPIIWIEENLTSLLSLM